MNTLKSLKIVVVYLVLVVTGAPALAAEFIIVQSTTSTRNSGLYEHLLPIFQAASDIEVRVVSVGTGQAIRNAQNCDGDVLLVHAREAEEDFVAAGYGGPRHDLMYNDFIIAGPEDDPAGIAGSSDVVAALRDISTKKARFASRGDDSGTHKKEMQLWREAGIDPLPESGTWYRETGSGMGATLNVAIGMAAYVLTDRASWESFGHRGDFVIAVEGDVRLFNQYGIIAVSKDHCPAARVESGRVFIDWMLSPDGQAAIADFRVNGKQLFFPNARTD